MASVARRGTLTVSRLKRSLNKAMAARARPDLRSIANSALDIEVMYRPDMFASGSLPLPLADRPLDAAVVSSRHCAACLLCSQHDSLHPEC